MPICEKCNHEISENILFCPHCGNRQGIETKKESHCPKCGSILQENVAFCNHCGERVIGTIPSPDNLSAYDRFVTGLKNWHIFLMMCAANILWYEASAWFGFVLLAVLVVIAHRWYGEKKEQFSLKTIDKVVYALVLINAAGSLLINIFVLS